MHAISRCHRLTCVARCALSLTLSLLVPILLQVEPLKPSEKEIDLVKSVRRLLVVYLWAILEQYATT